MRLLFVSHTGGFSGAEAAMIRLLRALPPDVRTAVACPPRGRLAEALAAEGVEVLPIEGTSVSFRLRPRTTAAGLAALLRSMAALRRHTRRWRPDVIHANGPRAGLVAASAGGRGRPGLVVQVHDVLPAGRVAAVVRRVLAWRADRITGVSDAASTAFNAGLRSPVATTTYISIDLDHFRPDGHDRPAVRRSLGVPPDAPVLGVVAQISPWKGQHTAIEALVGVRERHPRAQLVIAGAVAFSGPSVRYDNRAYLHRLHARVAELELEDAVHFVGHRSDVAGVMASLDLLLLPSENEPFGTAVTEAMATGTVPLVGAGGGPSEFVEDGRSGRVLPTDDPAAWARAAADLLDEPELRARMGARAIEVAQRFTDEAYAASCMAHYREAARA